MLLTVPFCKASFSLLHAVLANSSRFVQAQPVNSIHTDMRLLLILFVALFVFTGVRSQHHHFFYIQSDQQQLFYVKIGTEVMSSSTGGFLIIPKLKDSAFDMIIGFPKDLYPEYRFRITRVNKDKGLALKNFAEKGWGLFDLQTLEITMGEKIIKVEAPKEVIPPPLTNDAFTAILATVIDDPGLMATQLVLTEPAVSMAVHSTIAEKEKVPENQSTEKVVSGPPIVQQEIKAEVITPVQEAIKPTTEKPLPSAKKNKATNSDILLVTAEKKETKGTVDSVGKGEMAKDATTIKQVSHIDSVHVSVPGKNESGSPVLYTKVRKVSEAFHDSVLEMVFIDQAESGKADTIRVVLEKGVTVMAPALKPVVSASTVDVPAVVTQKTGPESGKDAAVAVPENTIAVSAKKTDTTLMVSRNNTRTACSKLAEEKDVTGLRRKMVGLKDEDDMVAVALKDFKQKCFTTAQVKNMSFVFVRDEGRYKLLDAAYPYVYDPDNFTDLESLLSDPYFVHRFRALLKFPVSKVP
jgi:Domain of unknown function (DUF4476)